MARSFNGTSDKIVANAAASFTEQAAFSVAFWLKHAADNTVRQAYSESRSSSANPFLQLGKLGSSGNAKMIMVVRNDAGGTSQLNSVQSTASCIDGTWHHFIYTQDASGHWQAYVDGAADASGTYTTGATTINQISIGCHSGNGSNISFWAGTLAHVAKWNRQITAGEAKGLGNGLSPLLYAPAHYWPLFGADSPEPDLVSAHTAGTLTGTAFAAGHDSDSLLNIEPVVAAFA